MNNGKILKIAIPVGICVIAICILLFFIPGFGMNKKSWEEYYDLGMQYLQESDYEEAIVAFTSAIRVDDKRAAAYTGRGDAHMGYAAQLNEEEKIAAEYEAAIADYEKAEELGDTEAGEKAEAAQNALENQQNAAEYEELLSELYDVLESGDTETAEELIKQDEYIEMNDGVKDGPLYYDEEEGVGLGVYPDGYYYFGEWKDGMRSGHGIWMKTAFNDPEDIGERYIFEGEWSEDKPNGKGEEIYQVRQHGNYSGPYVKIQETSGNFVNGLGEGQVTEVNYSSNGKIETYVLNVAGGVYQITGKMPDGSPSAGRGDKGTYRSYDGVVRVFVSGFQAA